MRKLSVKAYGKLNLTLDCLDKRPDGYHNLKSIMHPISLYDLVTLEKTEKNDIEVDCDFVSKTDNLVFKAANAFFESSGITDRGIKITVEKQIPLLSGLGGGSSDAAAVINMLDSLYGTGFSDAKKIRLANSLGADVPFALFNKSAVAEGTGEKLSFIENFPRLFFVLIKPCHKESTAEMYKKLDILGQSGKKYTDNTLLALESGDIKSAVKSFGNDFTVCQDQKYFNDIFLLARKYGALTTSLTGSGPTYFSVFEKETDSTNFFNSVCQSFLFVSLAKSVG